MASPVTTGPRRPLLMPFNYTYVSGQTFGNKPIVGIAMNLLVENLQDLIPLPKFIFPAW